MHKEIHEQPEALVNATRGRLIENDGTVKLSGIRMTPSELARVSRIIKLRERISRHVTNSILFFILDTLFLLKAIVRNPESTA